MTLPKFIITLDGTLRLGMVNQHKELLKSGDQCIGSTTMASTMTSMSAKSWI